MFNTAEKRSAPDRRALHPSLQKSAQLKASQTSEAIELPRNWRSIWFEIALFFGTSYLTIILSQEFSETFLYLPFGPLAIVVPTLIIFPFAAVIRALFLLYNSHHEITPTLVRTVEGIWWLSKTDTVIRYADIYGAEVRQNIVDRILNVGDVIIGTSMTGAAELKLEGILDPNYYAEVIDNLSTQESDLDARSAVGIFLND